MIDFDKQRTYESKLAQIYATAPDTLKDSVSQSEFQLGFVTIQVNGVEVEPTKPEDFEVDDDTFEKVLQAFREVYR